jgi:hypothetical protein
MCLKTTHGATLDYQHGKRFDQKGATVYPRRMVSTRYVAFKVGTNMAVLSSCARFVACIGLALSVTAAQAETLQLTGTYMWKTRSVVGLSALEVQDGGEGFVALGDRGWYISGRFTRNEGHITGVTVDRYLPILGLDGLPSPARRFGDWSDAEGLAIGPDGEMWISFERWTRVVRYTGPEDIGTLIRPHPSFTSYRDNRQLESVALHPDGTLYAFAEAPQADGFAIYRLREGQWDIAGHIVRRNRFAIVGADFDATGRLFLLERKHFLGYWWQNRIRILDVNDPDTITTLWTSGMGDYDNLEGIAVWQGGAATRLTVVSDNNGQSDETTQFLEFELLD